MVNAGLWKNARLAMIFVSEPKTFLILKLQDRDLVSEHLALAFKKLKHYKKSTLWDTFKNRLWELWNSTKILHNPWFLKYCTPTVTKYVFVVVAFYYSKEQKASEICKNGFGNNRNRQIASPLGVHPTPLPVLCLDIHKMDFSVS